VTNEDRVLTPFGYPRREALEISMGPRDADKTEAASNPTFFGETLPSSFDVIRAEYFFVLIPGMNLLHDLVSVNPPFVCGT